MATTNTIAARIFERGFISIATRTINANTASRLDNDNSANLSNRFCIPKWPPFRLSAGVLRGGFGVTVRTIVEEHRVEKLNICRSSETGAEMCLESSSL